MPQKKNPDIAELVRGKTGRVYGALNALLTTMKGIPLAYNKDMQEDKEWAFDAMDTAKGCITLFAGMLKTMQFNKDRIYQCDRCSRLSGKSRCTIQRCTWYRGKTGTDMH